ncbi:MAG TPA: PKD domain-containing protein [Thermoanaerobaculia bacterium]|nr:PKD domain-containing protein [Thermoanaerobaculia bacterium]
MGFLIGGVLSFFAVAGADAAGGPKHPPQPPGLYRLDNTPRPPTRGPVALPDAAEEFLIEVDPEIVAANPTAFLLDLPAMPLLEAVRTRFVVYRPDWKSWIGTLRYAGTQGEGTGYIHLGYHGEQLTALIHFEGERYQIVGGFWEPHRLVRLADELSVRSCGLDDSAGGAEPLVFAGPSADLADEPPVGALSSTRIDVLAVYPKVFFGFGPANEVAVFNFAADSISLANDIFTNGNISAYYNLVSVVPITAAQPPATGIYDALDWLTQQPVEVANLRNAFGADIVTVYVPYIWTLNPACAVANLPQKNYATFLSAKGTTQGLLVSAPFNQRAFSANRVGCGLGDFTLGHEIGHNYGMRHETGNTSPTVHLFPTGRGYDIPGLGESTVMGCACGGPSPELPCGDPTNAVCNRIPYFSDPTKFYQSVPIGTADRNNAAVAHAQAAHPTSGYASFRAQSMNTPPFANFTVSCSGRTCTFNASSSTDNLTIPSTGYWWDFGDNTTGTGKIVNHTYSYGTFFWVHLVVKDSGGQTDVTINSASPQ